MANKHVVPGRPPMPSQPPPADLNAPAAAMAGNAAPAHLGGLGNANALGNATVQCGRCRNINSRDLKFCQYCGARLGSEEVITPEARPGAPAPGGASGGAAQPAGVPAGTGAATGKTVQPGAVAPPGVTAVQAPVWGRLVVIAQDGTTGREYPLEEEQTDIGREEGGLLLPSDPYVSPRHARVVQRDGRFFVRDLGSVNGVYLRLRSPERLQNADLVLIGLEVLRFEVVSDAEKGLGPANERGTRVFGSPASPRYARLLQRTVEGTTRDIFYLTREETVVGRETGDLVFTNDPFMSRRHALFQRDPSTGTFLLQDLGSSNGTYLAIRGEHELTHGDHMRVGQHLFRLDVEPGRYEASRPEIGRART